MDPGSVCLNELFSRNALGEILSQLFPDYDNLFAVGNPDSSSQFDLLSVYVQENHSDFVYVGSLDAKDELVMNKLNSVVPDLLQYLKPYLHNSDSQHTDCYLTGVKSPFNSVISEFDAQPVQGYAMGKYFSWLELGNTRMIFIDPAKLRPRLKTLKVNIRHPAFSGRNSFYLVYQICQSSRLDYYNVKRFVPSTWSNNDSATIYKHIKHKIKIPQRLSISCNTEGPRAFTMCQVNYNPQNGNIEDVEFDLKLFPCHKSILESDQNSNFYHFRAEVLDREFLARLADQIREMKTRHIWQPVMKEMYMMNLDEQTRQKVLQFLLDLVKRFQTDDVMDTQMVDRSMVVQAIPQFLMAHQHIMRDILRGVGIILTNPTLSKDSDDEEDEQQIIFQPLLCQKNLAIMEKVLTVLTKGIVTTEQGESAAKLKLVEVASLQELYYTQMSCWCSPQKTLNPRENPLSKMWIEGSRTRTFLESFGIHEKNDGKHVVVLSPTHCQLVSVLALFFSDDD